ncbi:MAG: helix-turn-helix domain-containing protein [Bacteroidetes bacterium]|nr:helix-turn-helix domain-containing protein [Bacteroidota bacterium]
MANSYLIPAFESQCRSHTHKFVLVSLADQASADGECWPSIRYISERCQLSRRHVQRILSDLEEDGMITRNMNAQQNGVNLYKITGVEPVESKRFQKLRGEPHDTVTPESPHDTQVTPPMTRESPKPSYNHHKNHQEKHIRARSKFANAETQKEVAREQWYKYTNKAIRVYLEVFKRPINDYESQILTRHVTGDMEAWRHTCQVWDENDHNPTNIPDLIKKYKSTLELEGNEIERATNLPKGVKLNLERMKKEGTISERGIKKVLAGELTIKSNPQGYLKLVEVKK